LPRYLDSSPPIKPHCGMRFYALPSDDYLQLVAEWRVRLSNGAPRALRISVAST